MTPWDMPLLNAISGQGIAAEVRNNPNHIYSKSGVWGWEQPWQGCHMTLQRLINISLFYLLLQQSRNISATPHKGFQLFSPASVSGWDVS